MIPNVCFLPDFASVIIWAMICITLLIMAYLWYTVKIREIEELELADEE